MPSVVDDEEVGGVASVGRIDLEAEGVEVMSFWITLERQALGLRGSLGLCFRLCPGVRFGVPRGI